MVNLYLFAKFAALDRRKIVELLNLDSAARIWERDSYDEIELREMMSNEI